MGEAPVNLPADEARDYISCPRFVEFNLKFATAHLLQAAVFAQANMPERSVFSRDFFSPRSDIDCPTSHDFTDITHQKDPFMNLQLKSAAVLSPVLVVASLTLAQSVQGPVNALVTEGQPLPGNSSLIVNTLAPASTSITTRVVDGPGVNSLGGFVLPLSTGTPGGSGTSEPTWHLFGRNTNASPLGSFRSTSASTPDGTILGFAPTADISDTGQLSYVGRTTTTNLPQSIVRSGSPLLASASTTLAPAGVSQWGNAFSVRNGAANDTWFSTSFATTGTTPNASGLFRYDGTAITPMMISGNPVIGLASTNVSTSTSASPTNFRLSPNGIRFIGGFSTTGATTGALVSNGNALTTSGSPVVNGQLIPTAAGGNGTETITGVNGPSAVSDNGNWVAQIDSSAAANRLLMVNGNVVYRGTNSPLVVAVNNSADYAYIVGPSGNQSLFFNGQAVLSNGSLVNPIGSTNQALTLSNVGSANSLLWIGERDANSIVPMYLYAQSGGAFSLFSFNVLVPEPTSLALLAGASMVLMRRRIGK
jgi:hypothetical protein